MEFAPTTASSHDDSAEPTCWSYASEPTFDNSCARSPRLHGIPAAPLAPMDEFSRWQAASMDNHLGVVHPQQRSTYEPGPRDDERHTRETHLREPVAHKEEDDASSSPQDLVIHLEIQQLPLPGNIDSSAGNSQPLTRRFVFENHTRLLLGRSPSSQSDEKTRDRQFLEEDLQYGRAQAENGHDNGLFANQVISKRHAALYEQDGQLMLSDLGSTHGTYVNGRCIEDAYELRDLDRVRLGRNVVRKDIPYEALEFTVRIQKRPLDNRSLRENDGDDGLTSRSQSPVLEDEQDGGSPSSTMELESESQLSPDCYDWVEDTQQGLESDERSLQGSEDWVLDKLDMEAICEEDLTILEAPRGISVSEHSQVVILEKTKTEVVNSLTQSTEVIHLEVAENMATSSPENTEDVKQYERSTTTGKRKATDAAEQPHTKRTALVAAALAGVVVGSIGTVFTLASF
ncbi:hypothetical protein KVV02_003803 [Mortierella alpina]|uniref:FHA domain-containing protein n=1 Tax=Mortierella alpina TaxID=64518 RepID=A0A9P8I9C9_MORAP|nr:hypothetical protein KVV02_003803 [Mortierella alpina]